MGLRPRLFARAYPRRALSASAVAAVPDSARQIEQALFETAVELPDAAARDAFLDQACSGRPEQRARLARLLAAHAAADAFFERPRLSDEEPAAPVAPSGSASADDVPPASIIEQTGARIGRYRLLERIGEGGCGVVYLAEQQEPVRRRVALKIIRLGMDTERVVARFELERQALALMNHPNVARVLDAGATETGRPYFVMELVEGAPITDYCDRLRLEVRERLRLFIEVCHAIQHAHQKGVLHRDIKPSNVLVATPDGAAPAPKVIDFGVAKAVSPGDLGGRTVGDGIQFLGTPAYMSPEQAEPDRLDVDTRADIYGLGALLYELLAGRPPFDSRALLASGLDQLRRTLRETDPLRPSRLLRSLPAPELDKIADARRADPRALLQTLRRDLDWIVMRALEKDRSRRYATVNALAFDIGRYLRDEPVEARPPSRSYRLRKLVRRNRVAFAAGAAVALALAGGLGVSTRLYFRERAALREQTVLRSEAEIAGQLTRAVFLTREGNFAAADQVLAAVPRPLARPSFDGVTAFRAVGDWHAHARRWTEAADRFQVALEIGRLDVWMPVTLDHQAYCVSLLFAGDEAGYARYRVEAAERIAAAIDTEAVGNILKTCLLRPLDPQLRERLLPLGARAEFRLSALNPRLGTGWPLVPVALWRYRLGDHEGAAKFSERGYSPDDHRTARNATFRIILGLCALQTGRPADAAALLDAADATVSEMFAGDLARGNGTIGFWHDWAVARLLLHEARALQAAQVPR